MNAPLRLATVQPTADPRLERELAQKLSLLAEQSGSLGELEPLATRLGLIQGTASPQFTAPQLVLVAGDHGLAVDGVQGPMRLDTRAMVNALLAGLLPCGSLASLNGLRMTVVDAGIAEVLPDPSRLLNRKIAHGTRNARMGPAMSVAQAQAAIQSGMELVGELAGDALLCAGFGVGARESAALVLSRLTETPVRDLLFVGPLMSSARAARLMGIAQGALARHPDAQDPVEVLAAFGGFEMATLVGMQLAAARRRQLIVVDGLCALGALMVASRLAPAVTDYCVFSRSQAHSSLDNALSLFRASAVLEMGMDSVDGSGAALAWPLIHSAAALLARSPATQAPAQPVRTKR
jgi:nicotinate-nucleotide--dimethylbenzimidazole phosphoribosyltransferase